MPKRVGKSIIRLCLLWKARCQSPCIESPPEVVKKSNGKYVDISSTQALDWLSGRKAPLCRSVLEFFRHTWTSRVWVVKMTCLRHLFPFCVYCCV